MKISRVPIMVGLAAIVAYAGLVFCQERVIAAARRHADACIQGRATLRLGEREFREHCARGIVMIEVTEANFDMVEFRVWNTEHKACLLGVLRSDGKWAATGCVAR